LQISAWIAADTDNEQRAAILLGAAETLWHRLGSTILIFPAMGRFQDRCDQQMRSKLGPKQVATAREQGAAMSRDEAAAFALDEQPPQHASPHSEMSKLTKREREVAALVAQGLTNRAIAESLVVSQRTAQGHVENILMKLGFTSRTQIAAWVAQQQVSTQSAVT
jgi:non-specific serine/threonine protein kinase